MRGNPQTCNSRTRRHPTRGGTPHPPWVRSVGSGGRPKWTPASAHAHRSRRTSAGCARREPSVSSPRRGPEDMDMDMCVVPRAGRQCCAPDSTTELTLAAQSPNSSSIWRPELAPQAHLGLRSSSPIAHRCRGEFHHDFRECVRTVSSAPCLNTKVRTDATLGALFCTLSRSMMLRSIGICGPHTLLLAVARPIENLELTFGGTCHARRSRSWGRGRGRGRGRSRGGRCHTCSVDDRV